MKCVSQRACNAAWGACTHAPPCVRKALRNSAAMECCERAFLRVHAWIKRCSCAVLLLLLPLPTTHWSVVLPMLYMSGDAMVAGACLRVDLLVREALRCPAWLRRRPVRREVTAVPLDRAPSMGWAFLQ